MLSLQIHEKEAIKKIAKEFYLWRIVREPNIKYRNMCDWVFFKYPDFFQYNEHVIHGGYHPKLCRLLKCLYIKKKVERYDFIANT